MNNKKMKKFSDCGINFQGSFYNHRIIYRNFALITIMKTAQYSVYT